MKALALAGATVLLAASAAAAADAPKSLRTLVYDVTYDAKVTQETRSSGIGGAASGRSSVSFAQPDHGTVTIDVLAATEDSGLIVDASFAGAAANQAPIRFAIASDGSLRWDTRTAISAETQRLVPMLARGIVSGRDLAPGADWSAPAPPPEVGDLHYKVRSMTGTVANLAVTYSIHVPPPANTDETGQATVVYDTFRVCPIQYDLTARAHTQSSIANSQTIDYRFIANLKSDTMASAKPPS